MPYLIPSDYKPLIQDVNLQQIIGSDNSILLKSQLLAQGEAVSYLKQKYNVSREFADLLAWSNTKIYLAGARVYDTSNVIYSAIYPFPEFVYSNFYNVGDKVFWKNSVYTCQVQTPLLDHDAGIQYLKIENLPLQNVAPDDMNDGTKYWGVGVPYSITAGTLLSNTTYWQAADNRDQQLVAYVVDLTLYHVHTRIAPRNIPELRLKRYDDALAWFMMCAKGEVTPNLPLIEPKQGNRIRYGGSIRQINSY